ncbi:protein-disulfide reductase DsbD N-terminal domain-containing protein [Terrimonas sp. NA20]|uniref:Protein-disulfide reductase DsbD N-terminal domain-containing protein n=1 Tax=Terrimonas ginsenosidimutans TaxID=2908004 RepID=A0ABS9KW80_9BACT|nr:protein-disulfide reductase DsbD domain-containing protein [Terrimonas ginsenosidimutans]MCG2616517.1 protein-disulfide reductase DsbD N-terminal domain-containing protein [Terrimonas ginsenosidimutans]
MKQLVLLASVFLMATIGQAQQNPVSWAFSAKKVADKQYEVHMTATIQKGWHLYSQVQPEDAVAMPTTFKINNNPLVTLEGAIKEDGKLEKFHDAKLELSANQFSNKVDFVQVVKLKANAKTNVTGVLEFQTCNDQKCLPPKKVNFTIDLN